MRYDKPVFFQHIEQGEYNPATGNYGPDSIRETKRYASVCDTGTEMMQIVYGRIKQGSITIQLQTHYNDAFDRIRFGNVCYRVDHSRKLRAKHVFVVSEVQ